MATATKPKTQKARFEADGTGLTITVKRNTEVYNQGKKESLGDGEYVRFLPTGLGGQFYETADPAQIELLRSKAAGSDPKFVEVPVPVPASAPVLAQITKLAVRGDVDALVALAQEEEDTHQRQDVIDSVADALEHLSK
jgi:hypothetical protein